MDETWWQPWSFRSPPEPRARPHSSLPQKYIDLQSVKKVNLNHTGGQQLWTYGCGTTWRAAKYVSPLLVVLVHNLSLSGGAKICLGVTLAILSGLLFTFTNFLFQYLKMNPTEALAVRSALQILLLGTILVFTCKPFYPGTCSCKALLSLQGFCSSLRVGCGLSSMTYIPLADALTIIFTEPLWTLLLAKVFSGTQISLRKLLFCLLLIAGSVLVIKPPGIFPAPSMVKTLLYFVGSQKCC